MLCAVPVFAAEQSSGASKGDAQWVNQVFQKGKSYYETGNYTAAQREWQKLDPYLDQYPSFKKVIGYLKSQIQTAKPDASIRVTLQKGRVAYENGDWQTALAEWSKVESYLDPSSAEYAQFQKLKRDYETARLVEKQTAPQTVPIVPSEFSGYLTDASQKLQKQIVEVQSRKEQVEKDAVFHQAWMDTTFDRGKTAFEAGNYDLAIEEWDKLSEKARGQPEMSAAMAELKRAYRQFQAAELAYAQAGERAQDSPANERMSRLLEQASADLQRKAGEVSREGMEKQQSAAELQKRVDTVFQKGQELYQQGKYKEAMDEWMVLQPSFEGDPVAKAAFLSAQGSLRAYDLAVSASQSSVDSGAYKVRLPDGFFRYVENASRDLAEKTRQAENDRQKTEAAVSAKRAELIQTYERGKNAYSLGRVEEAVAEWKKLAPWVDNTSDFEAQLQKIEASYAEASRQVQALKQAQAKSAEAYVPPAGLAQTLASVDEDLKNQARSASNERLLLEQGFNDRQARITGILYKANLAAKSGKIEQAVAEWEKLLPYLEPVSEEKALVESLKQDYADYAKASQELRDSIAKKDQQTQLPADLKKNLSEMSDKLVAEAAQARVDLKDADSGTRQKLSVVASAQEKARLFFETGRYEEAVGEWEKLFPYMESASSDRLLIENFKQNVLDSKEASRQLAVAVEKSGVKAELPADLKESLAQTIRQLAQKAGQAQADHASLAAEADQRQAAVASAIEKGRIFQQTGRLEQAVAEWSKLLPYLDPASQDYVAIEAVRQGYADYAQNSTLRGESLAKKEAPAALPEDLRRAVSDTSKELIERSNQMRRERDDRERALAERHAAIQSAVEKGKLYFQTSRIDPAIAEWEKLSPYLDAASEDRLLIDNLKQAQAGFKDAASELKDVTARADQKTEIPADLRKTLSEISQAFIQKTEELRTQRQSLEEQVQQRQTQVLTALERARVYTQAGRIAEALAEFKKIAESLDDRSGAKALVRELDANYARFAAARQALDQELARKDEKLPPPEGLGAILDQAAQTIASDSQALGVSRQTMENDLARRQAFVDKTFQNGKEMAVAGKWLEALYEWEKLLPYLDERSGIAGQMRDVKKSWQALQEDKRSNELFVATRYNDLRMPFTEEMERMMLELDGTLQKQAAEAHAQRSQMEKTLAERQSWVETTFEKGKAYYEAGKFKEAVEFWTSLSPHLRDQEKVRALIQVLPQHLDALTKAQEAAARAESISTSPIEAPQGLAEAVERAAAGISQLSNEALSRTGKAEQADAQRRTAVNQLFEEGRTFAQNSQWEAAVKAWSGMLPHLAQPEKIKASLDNLAASHAAYVQALSSAAQAEADLNTKIEAPEELAPMLSEASFNLDKERQSTELARERTDKILTERQTAVEKLFTDGKALYDQGKLPDAFAAWRSMLPSVQGENELRGLLDKADQSYQLYVSAKEQNQQSLARKEMKLEAPPDLTMMLETINTQLRDQIFDMKTKSTQTEKMLADRKDWIDVTFQKGKLAYTQGRYQEAAAEWKTLLPFVEDGARLEQAISDFERNLQVSLDASKTGAEAEAKKNAKFPAPDELGVLLVQLNEKVKNEALEAGAEKIRAEQQFSERQKWLKQTYDLGRSFYMEGKYDQAIAEWEKLAPYLEAQSGVQSLLDAVKQSYQDSMAAKKGAVEAAAGDYQGLKLPYAEQMARLLTEVDAKLKEEAAASRAKQGEVEKTLAERQEWALTTFNKGKVFYDQGRYEEALGQWERLLPYLADSSEAKRRIVSMRESFDQIHAVKEASGASGGSEPPVKLANEQEMLSVLEEANGRLKSETEALQQKQLEANQSLEQRKQWIEFTFQKGKTFYDQGNYAKAVEEWGVLGPYLGEHPAVRQAIEEAKRNYEEGRYAQRLIESVEARKAGLAALPPAAQNKPAPPVAEPEQAGIVTLQESDAPQSVPSTAAVTPAVAGEQTLASGEIVSVDEPARTITLKLYTENGTDETLTINFDEGTQLAGSVPQPLSSMPSGAAIDVRYNPDTSRAQYIYVY